MTRHGYLAAWSDTRLTRFRDWARRNDVGRVALAEAALASRFDFAVLDHPGLRSLEAIGSADRAGVVVIADGQGRGPKGWTNARSFLRWATAVVLLDGTHDPDRYIHALSVATPGARVLLVSTTEAAGRRWESARVQGGRRLHRSSGVAAGAEYPLHCGMDGL